MISSGSGAGELRSPTKFSSVVPISVKSSRERQREHHAPVGRLQDVAAVVLEAAAHHDMAALDQAHRRLQRLADHGIGHFADPGPGGVDQHARGGDVAAAAAVEHQLPFVAPLDPHAAGAGADDGAMLGGIERVEHHQPGIVHPAVGIFEAVAEQPLERLADRMMGEIDGARAGQQLARAQPVVEEQPEPQLERRAQAGQRRQHEAHRPDHMRGHAQQHLALAERLAHQAEGAALEIAQAAVDQLGGGRGGAGGEIVHLDQQHAQAAAGGVAGEPGSVDAAADDGEVEVGHELRICC